MRLLLISVFLFPVVALSQFQLADIFTDNMVLQRDKPVAIWGTGIPGKKLTVKFRDEKVTVLIKSDSSWSAKLRKQKASSVPSDIDIECENKSLKVRNVLTGDIWLCIGQSNMQWPLRQDKFYKEEISQTRQPLLRFYNPSYAGQDIYGTAFNDSVRNRLNTNDFYQGAWQQSDSSTAKDMSAVAYYFGKEIASREQIPIGLINLAIGGAPIETFIRKDALQQSRFSSKVKGFWLENGDLPVWARERGRQNLGSNHIGIEDESGPNHGFKPGFAYEGGVDPFVALPIKGIIWYQGESNAEEMERVREYGELQQLMIADYRKQWKQKSMPFFFVQLSSIERQHWPQFRDEQRKLLDEVSNVGMAVSSDIGDRSNVHPTNKKDVGVRLARWALNHTYRHKEVVPSGPLPVKAIYKEGKVIISFKYVAGQLRTADRKELRGFSIDGKSTIWAEMVKDVVIIPVNEKPEFVYYGWQPFTDANLVNDVELPASTFRISVK